MSAGTTRPTLIPSDEEEREYGIEAHAALSPLQNRVLKHNDAFAILDPDGDCGKGVSPVEGVFFRDTRYISRWRLTLARRGLLLLSSTLDENNSALTIALTNPDMDLPGGRFRKDSIAITRTKFIWHETCFERIALRNYDDSRRDLTLEISFDADFVDLFEVRGMARAARGTVTKRVDGGDVIFSYLGLDRAIRETRLSFDPPPARLTTSRATFEVSLAPGAATTISTRAHFHEPARDRPNGSTTFISALRHKRREIRRLAANSVTVESSNSAFADMMGRSASDIRMLLAATKGGVYPHAGIPWYSAVFGRDGLISALFMLWADPSIATGVLLHLAENQAQSSDSSSDAQPGKILHEQRYGETARTGEVPFAAYYGTVDATPLFVLLAGRYFRRTGDIATIERIWPNIKAALAWCDKDGDRDGDGLVEYFRETPSGLANQGWKDSYDSIFHSEGHLAEGPIALIEVQAYVHAAKLEAATLAEQFGESAFAEKLRNEASILAKRVNETFWVEDLGTYAIALDGSKRRCLVSSSNAGHVLLTDLAPDARAARVAASLVSSDFFCGWGIRTVASSAARYNPMSYHNGSVWPHDNALIALGLGRIGFKTHVTKIFEGLYAAQSYQPDRRLPELFCGFQRKRGRGPVSYPVSCSPQAWASAASFALLSACLGLEMDHQRNVVRFRAPALPDFLDDVTVRNLRIGRSSFDVKLVKANGGAATVEVLRRDGDAEVVVV